LVDGNGLPLVGTTTKANLADIDSALLTIDQLVIGRQKRRPKRLRADKGYDSIEFRQELRKRRIKSAITHREYENRREPENLYNDSREIRYSRKRWCVEQRIACLDQQRRLDFLFERSRESYEAFLTIAFIKCYLKVLSRSKNRRNRV
jgi:IS5 family transposase